MSGNVASNVERLARLIGFDPAKQNVDGGVLADAIKEINEERGEKLKEEAKKLLIEAIGLRQEIKKAENAFAGEIGKFNKGLGKILNRIESMSSGKPIPEEGEKDGEGEPENNG